MAPITLHSATALLHRAAVETTTTLLRRQVIVTDSTTGSSSGDGDDEPTDAKTLTGGAIAGIVIGSIVGLLLLIWIFRSCSNLGAPPNSPPNPGGRAWYDGVGGSQPSPATRSRSREPRRSHSRRSSGGHHHHHRHHSHSRHRSASRGEVREVREVRPVAVVRGQSPYRYEERRSRSRSHSRY
ncbi:hypothetical protein QBC39DRAFT_361694 [Podospora conica]|nr:hypothetical protein QBC39DRAFT_361694 [Schizothecium conicum]